MNELKLTIPGDPAQVSQATGEISAYCRKAGFSSDVSFRIQVVVAEAINNIINYATPEAPITLSCQFDDDNSEVIIEMVDRGIPFEQIPQFNFPQWEAENGRGWPIIFNWMDSVSHVRQGDENHMTMTKERE